MSRLIRGIFGNNERKQAPKAANLRGAAIEPINIELNQDFTDVAFSPNEAKAVNIERGLFVYSAYDPEPLWEFVNNLSQAAAVEIAMTGAIIGRVTQKKRQNYKAFSQIVLNEGTPNEKKFGDFIDEFKGGRKKTIDGKEYTLAQISGMCMTKHWKEVLKQDDMKIYLGSADRSEVYALNSNPACFDFAASLPLTKEMFLLHMATRFFRAVKVRGYIPPDLEVSINQVNYSRNKNGKSAIVATLQEIQQVFDGLSEQFDPKLIGFPLEELTKKNQNQERNDDLLLNAQGNNSRQVRANAVHDAVRLVLANAQQRAVIQNNPQ